MMRLAIGTYLPLAAGALSSPVLNDPCQFCSSRSSRGRQTT